MSEKQVTHTPGPWENASVGIGLSATQVVWFGENTNKGIQVIGTGKDKANARLIASAPELLEQCKLFEQLLSTLIMEGHSGADLERDNLRAILDKVEGESA
jgi:hypothetical protein